jgi:hypothetical protein
LISFKCRKGKEKGKSQPNPIPLSSSLGPSLFPSPAAQPAAQWLSPLLFPRAPLLSPFFPSPKSFPRPSFFFLPTWASRRSSLPPQPDRVPSLFSLADAQAPPVGALFPPSKPRPFFPLSLSATGSHSSVPSLSFPFFLLARWLPEIPGDLLSPGPHAETSASALNCPCRPPFYPVP